MKPLPFDLREVWPSPSPDAHFRTRVVDASLREASFRRSGTTSRLRRIIAGVILGGVGAAAALDLPNRPTLGGDALPTLPIRTEASVSRPIVWPLPAPAFAEKERQSSTPAPPRTPKKVPPAKEEVVTHYPLCGCSSGAIVCSCVEP